MIKTAPIVLSADVPEVARQFVAGQGLAGIPQSAGAVIAFVPLDKIVSNRYQKRQIDDVSSLAENIKAHGLKQNPVGRWHPDRPGVFELGDGHRRTAAYRLLAKDDPILWGRIPVAVQDLTDKQMFETCIVANEQRQALSAIERAISLRDYMREFKVSQTEAGKLFTNDRGQPLSQGAVSHLTSLLELPTDVQALVDHRELSEVPARALVRFVDWRPDLVIQIAAEAVKEPESAKRAGRVDTLADEALRRNAQTLDNDELRPWPMSWPGKPLKVPMALFMGPRPNDGTHQTVPPEIPPCEGCPFHLERHKLHYCLRQACFDTKLAMWNEREVARVAEKLEITAAAPDEKPVVIFPPTGAGYTYSLMQNTQRLLAAKLPELRIVVRPRAGHGEYASSSYGVADTLGSLSVALATINQGAVSVYLAKAAGETPRRKVVPEKRANETTAQTERRKAAEIEQREERALERIAYNHSRADVLWLVHHTAELIAERTVAGGGLLLFAIEENRGSYFGITEEMREATEALARRTGVDKLGHSYGNGEDGWKQALAASTPELDQLRRQYLAYRKLTRDVAEGQNATFVYGDTPRASGMCQSAATRKFGIELPANWDTPPVHHTAVNCWTCGRFSAAGAGKLTVADGKEGWRAAYERNGLPVSMDTKEAVLAGVWCPEHAAQGNVDWNKSLLKAKAIAEDAELAKQEAKAKPSKPASAARAAVSAEPDPLGGLGWLVTAICSGPSQQAKVHVKSANPAVLDACWTRLQHQGVGADRSRLDMVEAEIKTRKQAVKATKTATRKATTAAVALASRANHGRRHTQPAPKPSEAKKVVGKKAPKKTSIARKGK